MAGELTAQGRVEEDMDSEGWDWKGGIKYGRVTNNKIGKESEFDSVSSGELLKGLEQKHGIVRSVLYDVNSARSMKGSLEIRN